MKKVLILIVSVLFSGINMQSLSSNTFNKNYSSISAQDEKSFAAEIIISNNKHSKNGQLITGTKDYKKEFTQAINNIREQIQDNNFSKINISNLKAKVEKDQTKNRPLAISSLKNILTSENVEILSTKVTIKKVSNIQNSKDIPSSVQLYTYDIFYEAVIDGQQVKKSLNVYNESNLFSADYLLSFYKITFDVSEKKELEEPIVKLSTYSVSLPQNVKQFVEVVNFWDLDPDFGFFFPYIVTPAPDHATIVSPWQGIKDGKIGFFVGGSSKTLSSFSYEIIIQVSLNDSVRESEILEVFVQAGK